MFASIFECALKYVIIVIFVDYFGLSLLFVFFEISDINPLTCLKNSFAMFITIEIITLVILVSWLGQFAKAMISSVFYLSFITWTCMKLEYTVFIIFEIILPKSFVHISICITILTSSMSFLLSKLSFIFIMIGIS